MTKNLSDANFVCVGKIIKPQGIKGEVKILPLIDIPAIFNGKHPLFLEKRESKFQSATFRLGFAYVKFDEIADRNAAEKFRGKLVFITREEFDKLAVDDFLIEDLIGKTLCDENGVFVGQIMDVENYGFDDILVIKEDNRLFEVPFRKAIFQKNDEGLFVNRAEYEGAKVENEN